MYNRLVWRGPMGVSTMPVEIVEEIPNDIDNRLFRVIPIEKRHAGSFSAYIDELEIVNV